MHTPIIYLVNLFLAAIPSTRLFSMKRTLWRACGARVGEGVNINAGARIFGDGELDVGTGVWVGIGCTFIIPKGASVRIGSRCDIAPEVMFECGSHILGGAERRAGDGCSRDILIGAGTWIGVRAVLLGGARVGSGSIVAAGALVRPGVYPDNTLLGGVPARVIRRLSEEAGDVDA